MEIKTKFDIGQDIFYLERERVIEICTTCKGEGIINVTNGIKNWNIKCPDCYGKGKSPAVIHYGVAGNAIKEVIARRGKQEKAYTRYLLDNGKQMEEVALFADVEEAERQCYIMNETIKRDRR